MTTSRLTPHPVLAAKTERVQLSPASEPDDATSPTTQSSSQHPGASIGEPTISQNFLGPQGHCPLDIEVIGLDDRLAFLTDGGILPITHLIDADGEETQDPDLAVSFVVMAGRQFAAFAVDDFEPLVKQ